MDLPGGPPPHNAQGISSSAGTDHQLQIYHGAHCGSAQHEHDAGDPGLGSIYRAAHMLRASAATRTSGEAGSSSAAPEGCLSIPVHTPTDAAVLAPMPALALALRPSDEDESSDDEDGDDVLVHGKFPGRRLWDKAVTAGRWDSVESCSRALEFECPCDTPCLRSVRDGVIGIYQHRQEFQRQAGKRGQGGLRDELAAKLKEHYDAASRTFTNSFVVGSKGTCCERAYAVACGVSEATYSRARTDVRKGRPTHATIRRTSRTVMTVATPASVPMTESRILQNQYGGRTMTTTSCRLSPVATFKFSGQKVSLWTSF